MRKIEEAQCASTLNMEKQTKKPASLQCNTRERPALLFTSSKEGLDSASYKSLSLKSLQEKKVDQPTCWLTFEHLFLDFFVEVVPARMKTKTTKAIAVAFTQRTRHVHRGGTQMCIRTYDFECMKQKLNFDYPLYLSGAKGKSIHEKRHHYL